MKKQLLLSLAVLLFTVTTATANAVPEGGTVTIAAVPDEFGFGEYWCESNPSSNPNNGLILKLLSGTTASGTANINIERNTLNPQTLKWCMGGECSLLNNKTTLDKNFSVSNGSVQVQFDAENCRSVGDLLATLTATIGTETHTVKILFTYGTSDINNVNGDIQQDNVYFDLNGRRVDNPTKGVYITNGKKIVIK